MKKIFLILCMMVGLATTASAQQKKAVINTPGLHCEGCKERIESFLGRMYGVTAVNADVKKKIVTVNYLADRTDIEQIKTAIANRGYDADDVEAEETMVRRLPPACRKKPAEPVKMDSARAQAAP